MGFLKKRYHWLIALIVLLQLFVLGGFFNNQPPVFVERYSKKTCLNRMANETDIKGAIVYLASDASAYLTGASIDLDGGYSIK